MSRYTFTCYEQQDAPMHPYPEVEELRMSCEFSDGWEPWTAPLYEFCKFLSAKYGYDIVEKVFVETYGATEPQPISDSMSTL